jgi:hypothetical protein
LIPFDFALEGVERLAPELVEPDADGGEAGRIDVVDAPRALRPVGDEAGRLEDLQMLLHGRPAHRQAARQLADRMRPARHALEHAASRRVAKGCERGRNVSHNLP